MQRLSLTEVQQVTGFLRLLAKDDRRFSIRRDAVACLLGLHGLRITETCRLRTTDLVDYGPGKPAGISVRTIKRGAPRTVPVERYTLELLRKLCRHAETVNSAWVFHTRTGGRLHARNLRRRWNAWRRIYSMPEALRYHDLRHTAAHLVYDETNDVRAVQTMLGHKRTETTWSYLQQSAALLQTLPPHVFAGGVATPDPAA